MTNSHLRTLISEKILKPNVVQAKKMFFNYIESEGELGRVTVLKSFDYHIRKF
jgi:hypothetical protein